MNEVNIITNIKSLFSVLTKKEKVIGVYIVQNYKEVSYMNINELSEKLQVGETTILRFCKKIGYSGYHEFRQVLACAIRSKKKFEKENCISNAYKEMSEMLEDTISLSNYEDINRVASLIKRSDTIFLFGIGFSGLSAIGAQIRLNSMGHKAFASSDNYTQVLSATVAGENDLAIGLSISGETKQTIENLKLAKKNGARIVCLTNNRKSPITYISDIALITAGKALGEEGSTLITEMSQLFVLEQIFNRLHEIDQERIRGMNSKVSKYINEDKIL